MANDRIGCCSSWLLGGTTSGKKKGASSECRSKNLLTRRPANGVGYSYQQHGGGNMGRGQTQSRLERALADEEATQRFRWECAENEATKKAASVAYSIAVETSTRAPVVGGLVDLLEQTSVQFMKLHELTGEMELELEWARLKLALLRPVKEKLETKHDEKKTFGGSLLKIVRAAVLQLDEAICACSSASTRPERAALFVKSDSWFAKWAAVQDDVNKASDHLLYSLVVDPSPYDDDENLEVDSSEDALRKESEKQARAFSRAVVYTSTFLRSEEKSIYGNFVCKMSADQPRDTVFKIVKKLANNDAVGARESVDHLETALGGEEWPFLRGLTYYRENRLEDALRVFHESVFKDPLNADCWFAMGVAMSRTGHGTEKQKAAYKRALELDPNHALSRLKFGLCLAEERNYDSAEVEFEKAVSLDPSNSDALLALADLLVDVRRDADQAEKLLKRAVESDPRHAKAHNAYAKLLEDSFLAEKHFRLALELDPKFAIARNNYAFLLAHVRKNYDDAEMHYRLALESDPDLALAHYNYANLLKTVRRDFDLAKKHYEKAIELDSSLALAHNNLANLYYDVMKDPDKAETHYQLALKSDPSNASAHTNLGLLLHVVRRKFDAAERHYKEALRSDPTHADAHNNLGYLLQTVRGKYQQAEQHYRAALDADPSHAFTHESYGELLFDVYQAYTDAETHLKQAVTLNPNLLTAHLKLGDLYLHVRDDPDLALDFLNSALDLDPSNPTALSLVSSLYERRQAYHQAADYLKRYIRALRGGPNHDDDDDDSLLDSSSVAGGGSSKFDSDGRLPDALRRLAAINAHIHASSS